VVGEKRRGGVKGVVIFVLQKQKGQTRWEKKKKRKNTLFFTCYLKRVLCLEKGKNRKKTWPDPKSGISESARGVKGKTQGIRGNT